MNIKNQLIELKEEKYQKFHSKLVPGIKNVLGVRVPKVRKIAKELAKTGNWQDYKDEEYYEELMIQGLVICYANIDLSEKLNLLKKYIPKINNWGICDVVCATLKISDRDREDVWRFVQPLINSDKEFEVRFGIVILLNYFINAEYIDKLLKIFDNVNHKGYYVKMAIAWAISICFIKYWDKTINYLSTCKLDNWTYNKAIQKTCESYRISADRKHLLKGMKKKAPI